MVLRLSLTILLTGLISTAYSADEVIVTINGSKITKKHLETANKYSNNANPQATLNELVRIELLYQEAQKQKLDKDAEIAYMAELQKKNTYANAMLRKADLGKPPSEAEMLAFYEQNVKNQKREEYKARHILVKSEDEAKSIIEELDKGGNFEELAKSKSGDPSAKDGGDLGWFTPQQMVPEFSQVVANLSKGAYTRAPVKTQYGWHVIKLDDRRENTPPSYEESKRQIGAAIINQRVTDYIKSLEQKAKIDVPGNTAKQGDKKKPK